MPAVDLPFIPHDEQGVRRQHHPGRADRLHVCGEQFVFVHALQRALGAHADRQRGQLHRWECRRLRGHDPQRASGGAPFPNIICEAGDGSASDIGIGSISGALYRNHDCLIICYDNEQYANTGIQASSRTPYGGMTTFSPPGPMVPEAKTLFPKDLARMMAAGHPHCYVATASVGYPIDLMNKVRKGLNHKGAPIRWFTPHARRVSCTRRRARSTWAGWLWNAGSSPMWEWNTKKREYDYSFRPRSMRPVAEYLKLHGRFVISHPEHVATLQKAVRRQQWRRMTGVELPRLRCLGRRCEERGPTWRPRKAGCAAAINRMNTKVNPDCISRKLAGKLLPARARNAPTRDVRPEAAFDLTHRRACARGRRDPP